MLNGHLLHYVVSLSLGGPAKPTGLAVVEPRTKYDENGFPSDNYFRVRWLQRFAAGEPYPAIVARVREVAADKQLPRRGDVLVDITITGAAPLKLFRDRGLYPQPFQVTDATKPTYDEDGIQHVPRRDLIGAAQVAFQLNKLKVSSELELAPTLLTDLQAFDPNAPGGTQNNDLVNALSVGIWWSDRLTWDEGRDALWQRQADDEWETGRDPTTGY